MAVAKKKTEMTEAQKLTARKAQLRKLTGGQRNLAANDTPANAMKLGRKRMTEAAKMEKVAAKKSLRKTDSLMGKEIATRSFGNSSRSVGYKKARGIQLYAAAARRSTKRKRGE